MKSTIWSEIRVGRGLFFILPSSKVLFIEGSAAVVLEFFWESRVFGSWISLRIDQPGVVVSHLALNERRVA